ncbi:MULTISPECIES: hypothetical protein [unclassified Mesorhizobium]|uniref:hypothetical protein n=1 Tax=unclassified Mesorhizobium TaxID=325217 RepID=UPI000FCBC3E0|nr:MULTISPECIES: hypothetical protein [unclassified Mesorhizobium]RUV98645.1 hypothetical protein EOA49_23410 [Mesorhizobium sp. M1A.F.Ca.IN.020.04.1.1]RUW04661.1 hypothetical protein EOA53_27805 [Mesorhizobium sp. M1A.F.Ca.IN.020.03.1.1]RWF66393.1 MAG: hypothetical protein EOQ34_28200 [Mesorhizobium sp.]RWG12618.1 MAG: hypothetical protein EOQ58_20465 [Mesorhizobium sp.]RWG29444.1 MAG: hypothetical protein EOQ61_18330 [Mesorhizobium sp.]
MTALYPVQDVFTRGEISPRLHSRASLDLYRAALAQCENFVTLPHGGIRARGGTYFVAEVKNSAKKTRGIPFIFSSDQAYCLEFGDLYIRVYAYGARVGTVEIASPYLEADLFELAYVQSADQMWITHRDYPPKVLTRTAHTAWTLEDFEFLDGPYDDINDTATTLAPSDTGHLTPKMTSNTTPAGTVSATAASADDFKMFDRDKTQHLILSGGGDGLIRYRTAGGAQRVVDAYWLTASSKATQAYDFFTAWEVQGSNDGVSWTTLDTRTGELGWGNGETRFYDFPNKSAFEYHQLVFSGGGGDDATNSIAAELAFHVAASDQTPFDLTASGTAGINGGAGFQATDVGRAIRLLGSDGVWRWAKITSRTSTTVVKIVIYGHALPNTNPITRWRLGTFVPGKYVESGSLYEERLAFSRRFSVYASATGDFDNFALGQKDDDALEFVQAGGGQANDILWIADSDGALLIGTSGGIRALSGSGIDEALTPSSFKNRRSRTFGCARIRPVDAGQSFLYVTRSRRAIAELTQVQTSRYQSEDIGQISEHIPKQGVVELAYQTDPDPILWFPLDNGELAGYTHQPSQEVRGMHRHRLGGTFSGSDWAVVESAVVTPGQNGVDDIWLFVKRTIGGLTKRYIEVMQAPFEYGELADAFQVDCGLTYSGAPVNVVSGLGHLNGQRVDVLGDGKVFRGLIVASGQVTLPSGASAAKWQVGLPFQSEADTLELDVGGQDGSIIGRRKKVAKAILSLLKTDTTGLEVQSCIRGRWEAVRMPSVVAPDGKAKLYTGNVEVPIDDSWEGQGRVKIRHVNPTPCTIRALTPVFEAEP